MKISVLDLGTIYGKIFKTPVLSTPTRSEKPRSASLGRQTVETFPITSSATCFSMLPDALSSTSSVVATNPVGVKRSVCSPMSAAGAVRELNSSMWQVTVQGQLTQSSSSFASKHQGASIRGNTTNLGRPTPNAVQTFQWNSPSKLHPLIRDTCSLNQEELHQKRKLNKQNPARVYSERSACPVPAHFAASVLGAIESFRSVSPSSPGSLVSGDRATPEGRPASWSGIRSCTTGPSTEQSSLCSWRDDEFDRVNTQRVCQLFSDVDELLYEGKQSSRTEALFEECKDWNGHSPHLRILGNQLEAPKQEGVQYFHSNPTCPSPGSALLAPPQDTWSSSRELCIEGQRVLPTPCALRSRNVLQAPSLASVLGEEEVYEAEGRIEEFFAYDAKEGDDEGADPGHRTAPRAARSGVPPVSPHACIKDAVAGEVFDDVWREVVHMLEAELLHRRWESELADGAPLVGTSESSKAGCDSTSHILIKTLSGPVSRGSDTRSMSLWPNLIPRQDSCSGPQPAWVSWKCVRCPPKAPRVSSAFKSNLNGVMTIQAKPLQQRQHGFSEKPQCDADDRPGVLMSSGKGQPRLMEHSVLSASRGACTFSQKLPAQRRLPKISVETRPTRGHGILRGPKLSTVTEGLASPTVNAASKQRLPSVRPDVLEQELQVPVFRHMQHRGRVLQSRVVSATHPGSVLPPLREPTLLLDSLPRPSTTHTFRSDTPIKRSFTPMDIAYHMRTGRAPLPGEPSRIGVTGFSVGITCSAALSQSECPSTQRRPLNPSSTEEEEGEALLPLGTCHQRKAFSRFPMHYKKKLQVALS
ncbi:protein FAM149A isoform X1 [Anguilla anguilla]|uniref:protein FAM149A isoform X1 n=1 Tax=Anguilla anguilla TaxID=7936 RepID=UPI0015B1A552|nr:protein FAM149A isoform X1 [Anguilla anguilla]